MEMSSGAVKSLLFPQCIRHSMSVQRYPQDFVWLRNVDAVRCVSAGRKNRATL